MKQPTGHWPPQKQPPTACIAQERECRAERSLCRRRALSNIGMVRGLTKWVVFWAVSACGGTQYEARSAADVSAPMAQAAPGAPAYDYEEAAAPAMAGGNAGSARGFGLGGPSPTDAGSDHDASPTFPQADHAIAEPSSAGEGATQTTPG